MLQAFLQKLLKELSEHEYLKVLAKMPANGQVYALEGISERFIFHSNRILSISCRAPPPTRTLMEYTLC